MSMLCRICNGQLFYKWTLKVLLERYEAHYFECEQCHTFQIPDPFWLDEAYFIEDEVVSLLNLDSGRFRRNFSAYSYLIALEKAKIIPKNPKILDFGGGYGLLAQMLFDNGYDSWTTDAYVSKPLFAPKQYIKDITTVPNVSFDVILALEVFEHLSNPWAITSQLRRILKPSGTLIISTEIYNPKIHTAEWWYIAREGGQHITFWTHSALQHYATQFKFRSIGFFPETGFFIIFSQYVPGELQQKLFSGLHWLNDSNHLNEITMKWDFRFGISTSDKITNQPVVLEGKTKKYLDVELSNLQVKPSSSSFFTSDTLNMPKNFQNKKIDTEQPHSQSHATERILLGQLGANGDCLHATTIARQIKHDYPNCHLTWAVSSLCRGMVEGNPFVDEIWEISVSNRDLMAAAWYEFEREAKFLAKRGEFDEVFLTQIYPNNYQNFDGTVRPSIFRAYPKPITVPVQYILRLRDDEVEKVRNFAEQHNLPKRRHVILFECASKSAQSFVTPNYALNVAQELISLLPDCSIILSSDFNIPDRDERIIDGSALSLRENAELTKYCTLFIGCASGVSLTALTDWAKPLPMIQLLLASTSVFASIAHELQCWGFSSELILEMTDSPPKQLIECVYTALTQGFAEARSQFHQQIPIHFNFYLSQLRSYLLQRGQYVKAARAILFAVERYGWHQQLKTFVQNELISEAGLRTTMPLTDEGCTEFLEEFISAFKVSTETEKVLRKHHNLSVSDVPESELLPYFEQILAALSRQVHQLQRQYEVTHTPQWLLNDYLKLMLNSPLFFQEIGETDSYYRYVEQCVNYIHSNIFKNTDSKLWKDIAIYFTEKANFIPLYFNNANLKNIYTKRADIIEFYLRNHGCQIDYEFPERSPKRKKICLGILAAHFTPQTEIFATLPVYKHLNRELFEIIIYTLNTSNHRLERYCAGHADALVKLPEDLLSQVRTIREAELDILFISTNITAVTHPITLLALHRLARLQMVDANSPVTTGMRYVDYYISSKLSEPEEEAQQHYTEKLVTLDSPPQCFDFATEEQLFATTSISRHGLDLSKNTVIYISGANYYKIIPEVEAAWAKIIASVPNSVLLLYPFNPNWSSSYPVVAFRKRITTTFAKYGLSEDRLVILDPAPNRADVKERLKLGDIYLDSYPYSGMTSLIDPLELGLTTIVMEAESSRSKKGASLLRELQIPDLITSSEAAYIQLAIALGTNPELRQQKSDQIMQKMRANPRFLDSRSYSTQMGALFQELFHKHQAIALTENFKLRETNLIIFPDWSQPEELLYQDLASAITSLVNHPNKNQTTLLIYIGNLAEDHADLFLSEVVMNLLMEEDLDVADGPEISLVGQLGEMQWEALLSQIKARIVLENENQQAIAQTKAETIPSCELDKYC